MKKVIHQENEDWKAKYLRALADYQNLERRVQDEKEEVRKFAAEGIIKRLLPAVDSLKRAKDHVQDAGLALAFKQLEAVLEELGVEKIDVLGKPFNPEVMECIEVVEGEENVVTEEVLPGYRFYGKLLRVAQVKVGKSKGG